MGFLPNLPVPVPDSLLSPSVLPPFPLRSPSVLPPFSLRFRPTLPYRTYWNRREASKKPPAPINLKKTVSVQVARSTGP